MASFVPHYRKKQLQRQELEGELMALLQRNANGAAVTKKIDEVRSAQVRALKERIAKLPASEKSAQEIAKFQASINACNARSATDILEKYRRKIAGTNRPVTIPRAPRRGAW